MSLIRASVERLAAYTPGEQPSDPAVLKLNTNENPYPPSPAVAEALRGFNPAALALYPEPTARPVREAAAALHGVGTDRVLVGNGSDEVLALCVRAFVKRPGRGVAGFDPSYSLYPVLAAAEDVLYTPVPLGDDFGWRRPPRDVADLFFLTHPNAPTGGVYDWVEIAAFCDGFEGVVVLDEAYVDFAARDGMELARTRPNVLSVRTLSKSHALAGLRVGYAVGPAPLIAALGKLKDSYNVDRLAQTLAAAALRDPAHMRANAARITATRARVEEAVRAMDCRVWPSQANFVWFEPPGVPAREVFERLRTRHRVLIRHFPGPRTGAALRVTIGTDAQMDRFLDALRESVQ
jgi:histidinol-phosphate aminotransferase